MGALLLESRHVLGIGFFVPGLLAQSADDGLKKEYFAFAELFTMRAGQYEAGQQQDRDGVKRAAAIHELKLSNRLLKEAAEEFDVIGKAYTAARDLWDHKPLNKEDVERLVAATFLAEIKEDKKMRADIFGEALAGALEKEATDRIANLIYVKARGHHAVCWKKILPLAKQCANSTDLKGAIRFDLCIHPDMFFRQLYIANASKKKLTNITIALETNASKSYSGDARRYYLFIGDMEPGNTIMLDTALVDIFPYKQQPQQIAKCLTYSIWSDQGSEEEVVLNMTGRNGRSPLLAGGTIYFPFTKQRKPAKKGK